MLACRLPRMSRTTAIDSLVVGKIGSTDRMAEMRVTAAPQFGWVGGLDEATGKHYIMGEGRFEIIGPARPEWQRVADGPRSK